MDVEAFREIVREALYHLYDYAFLQQSPLVRLFGLEKAPSPARALHEMLEGAIQALWEEGEYRSQRYHQILYARYVQEFTQRDIANQLGVTPRHLRREELKAVIALAERLREKLKVPLNEWEEIGLQKGNGKKGLASELRWLKKSFAGQASNIISSVNRVLALAGAMARGNIEFQFLQPEKELMGAIAPTVLDQVLLSLLTAGIGIVGEGKIVVGALRQKDRIVIRVEGSSRHSPRVVGVRRTESVDFAETIQVVSQLLEVFGGRVEQWSCEREAFSIAFWVFSVERKTVLAIEDNLDTLRLWERYLRNTPFQLIALPNPSLALEEAIRLRPDLIVLDVMMSEIDGWKLLGELRAHSVTKDIPLIVCTVLPQKAFALSLGADGFLQKPFTRRAFLQALTQQIEGAGIE